MTHGIIIEMLPCAFPKGRSTHSKPLGIWRRFKPVDAITYRVTNYILLETVGNEYWEFLTEKYFLPIWFHSEYTSPRNCKAVIGVWEAWNYSAHTSLEALRLIQI